MTVETLRRILDTTRLKDFIALPREDDPAYHFLDMTQIVLDGFTQLDVETRKRIMNDYQVNVRNMDGSTLEKPGDAIKAAGNMTDNDVSEDIAKTA